MSGQDLSRADLSGQDLSEADLSGARLFKANLRGAILTEANLRGADLTGADLSEAVLDMVDARQAGFGMADLRGARLFSARLDRATFTKADLRGADLRCAKLRGARIREADLRGCDLTEAVMRGCDLSLTRVEGADFDNADLRQARLRMVKGYEKASWIGTDIRDINFAGAYLLRRFIVDQNYIEEFRSRGRFARILYYLWLVTSDCGRSMFRWCFWIFIQTFFFAWLYTLVGVDFGRYPTVLSPLYYSVVTLTTLGYGDVVPKTIMGQLVAMAEVITGYLMLGGLLSILSNRLARRAD